ncbi:MAG TPA: LuxR C-terminal-related transcriptional regulator [Burkholderiaceae bacterium]
MQASPSLSPTFALAKIQPPRPRAGLIERPELERSLAAALQYSRLTLLLAPAGFGKTAALTRQIRLLPDDCALAWVSADEDDQLQRFLACLTAALEPHDLPWRVAPEALATLALAERGLRDAAGELVNALASSEVERGLIVIDDAHRIADRQVFELLQLVLDRLPARWAIAIASRVEPPLALARWRAAGEVTEFRQYDLRFSESDVAALLTNAPPGAPDVHELLKRTDGWAAGLRLSLSVRAGASARAGAPRNAALTQRHLFDYLATEVLADMPAELRDFLLRCSILPELTAARCAQVSERADAGSLLEQIERRGLFVSVLDADELTLRLHDLFRDFLEDRLQRDHPDELAGLLRRAAAGEPDVVRAIGFLARAGDWDAAAGMILRHGMQLIGMGRNAFARVLAMLPAEQLERRPDLHMLHGIAGFIEFDFDRTAVSFERATAGFLRDGRERDAWHSRTYHSIMIQSVGRLDEAVHELAALRRLPLDDALRAFVAFGLLWVEYATMRTANVAPLFGEMLDALERVPDPDVWTLCFFHSLLTGLPGLAPLAERFDRTALSINGDAPSHLRAGVLYSRAMRAFERGELDRAFEQLARADEDCRWLGSPRSVTTESHMVNTVLHALRGDALASHAAADACEHDLKHDSSPGNRLTHAYEILFNHIRACWLLNDGARLRSLDVELRAVANPLEWQAPAAKNRAFSAAMIALLDNELERAAALLADIAGPIEPSCYFPATQAQVMLAAVQRRLGDLDAAAATLRPWLADAQRGERIGGALLAGTEMLEALAQAPWETRLDATQRATLARVAAISRTTRGGEAAVAAHPVAGASVTEAGAVVATRAAPGDARLDPLTEREREVLQRMAAGDSNKLIARAFDLSPHTVKRHVANILGKLGVETRGQAAACWHDHAGS